MLLLLLSTALATPSSATITTARGPITIDGALDEPAWADAQPVTRFTRFQPVDGGPPSGRTEVRFLQDARNLYVGVRVTEVGYRVRAHVTPREQINTDDQIGLYLDTFRDGISGYIFYFNALGIQQDIRHNAGDWNMAWDTLLRSRGTVTADGYTLEVAIPWRSLKFPSGDAAQTWGALVTRKIPSEGAKYSWPVQRRGAPRLFQQAAALTGVRPPPRGSGVELIPALTAIHELPAPSDQPPALARALRPSLDARLGITPDLGLAATLNPDFSQVEADVSDIRLNARFAFDFPERRPFFLDGADWFQDTTRTLYTRSMNDPLYGIKLSGREGTLSLGALHVLDRAPLPSFNEAPTPGFSADEVAGTQASTSLLRLRGDAFAGGFVGATFADKRLLGGPGTHQSAAVDLNVPLADRWVGAAAVAHSLTGDGATQRWGTRQQASMQRASGIGTGGGASFAHNSPGYRNELGYTTQSDRTDVSAWLDHTFTPRGAVDTVRPLLEVDTLHEGNGDRQLRVGSGLGVLLRGIHALEVRGWAQRFDEQAVAVRGGGGQLSWSSNLGAAADVSFVGSAEQVVDYLRLVPASFATASADLALRPVVSVQNDLTLTAARLAPTGEDVEVSLLARNRLNWQLDRELGLRWVSDLSMRPATGPRFYNQLLFTWLRNPGTAVWVGGTVIHTPSDPVPTRGGVFAKVTALLRP